MFEMDFAKSHQWPLAPFRLPTTDPLQNEFTFK